MSYFIRLVGSAISNDYMSPQIMIYFNDHNWHDGVVTKNASDSDLATVAGGGPGMTLRLYVRTIPGNFQPGRLVCLYTHLFGSDVYVRSTTTYDTMDFSTHMNPQNLYAVRLADVYAQQYSMMSYTTGYVTLDFSLVMAREVLKLNKAGMSVPASLFSFMYEKGSGPLIYGVRYYIKTRAGTTGGGGWTSQGYRLSSTPEGQLLQTTGTDQSTYFYFYQLASTDKKNAYSIRDQWGSLLCITDEGVIERRDQVGPWEEFEVSPDWSKPGSFTITKRFDNDPYATYGFRFSSTTTDVSTWLLGSDEQGANDIFEIEPVEAASI
eukprot:GILI01002197.1.p1 GENE.GILI01002197.1~~GILI01002197.1.p1  ORF type:complete len:358 (-),score=61.28 GILI01002197.1:133-1098(-)